MSITILHILRFYIFFGFCSALYPNFADQATIQKTITILQRIGDTKAAQAVKTLQPNSFGATHFQKMPDYWYLWIIIKQAILSGNADVFKALCPRYIKLTSRNPLTEEPKTLYDMLWAFNCIKAYGINSDLRNTLILQTLCTNQEEAPLEEECLDLIFRNKISGYELEYEFDHEYEKTFIQAMEESLDRKKFNPSERFTRTNSLKTEQLQLRLKMIEERYEQNETNLVTYKKRNSTAKKTKPLSPLPTNCCGPKIFPTNHATEVDA